MMNMNTFYTDTNKHVYQVRVDLAVDKNLFLDGLGAYNLNVTIKKDGREHTSVLQPTYLPDTGDVFDFLQRTGTLEGCIDEFHEAFETEDYPQRGVVTA